MGYLVFFSPKLAAILFADKWDIQINGILEKICDTKTPKWEILFSIWHWGRLWRPENFGHFQQ